MSHALSHSSTGCGCTNGNRDEAHPILNEHLYARLVEGDVDVDTNDGFVEVLADPTTPAVSPTATLPCASKLEAPHKVTIAAIGVAVNVANVGTAGTEVVVIPANHVSTFYVLDEGGGDDAECPFWAPLAAFAITP